MEDKDYGSVYFARAVEAFGLLPGVGERSAQRFALHLLDRPAEERARFLNALVDCSTRLKRCPDCHGFSDNGTSCKICSNPHRDRRLLCIVSDIRDVMALERAGQYRGYYFVLGGLIDPMSGRGPDQLPMEALLARARREEVEEVILAFSVNMEGDTTSFYVQRCLEPLEIRISAPARGMGFGERLDQADSITLNRAIAQRQSLYTPRSEGENERERIRR